MCFFVMVFVCFFFFLNSCLLNLSYFIYHCYIFGAEWVFRAIYDVCLKVLRFITLRITKLIEKLEWILVYSIPNHTLYLILL